MCKTKDSYIHIIISVNFVSGYCSLIIRMLKETGLSAKAALLIYSHGNILSSLHIVCKGRFGIREWCHSTKYTNRFLYFIPELHVVKKTALEGWNSLPKYIVWSMCPSCPVQRADKWYPCSNKSPPRRDWSECELLLKSKCYILCLILRHLNSGRNDVFQWSARST